MTTIIAFGGLIFLSFIITLGICFLIVDHIDDNPKSMLSKLWRTGWMGHVIFTSTFLLLFGIAILFKNFL